jgi:ComF family protein
MPDPVNRNTALPVDGRRRWLGVPPWRPRCLGCGEAGVGGQDLCAGCRAWLPWNRHACRACALPLPPAVAGEGEGAPLCGRCLRRAPPLRLALAPFLYAAPLDRWLPRFKFHHDFAAGRLLSQLMLEACSRAPRPAALVPVPLHGARLRSRGYDQALELAKPLAKSLQLPLRGDLLVRRRATAPQSELHASQRRRNLHGAFVVAADAALPARVALLDDVMTTGATLHAAAEALLRAGVGRVDAWVCARVP